MVQAQPAIDLVLHVRYVVDNSDAVGVLEFLSRVVSPLNVLLISLGSIAAVSVVAVYIKLQPFQRDISVLKQTLHSYRELVPWMLRLSLGLPLVGAGFMGYFFTPEVGTDLRVFQVGVGFLLLLGLGTRVLAALGLSAYLMGVLLRPEMLLASEYVGGFFALMTLGSGRPSADHMLHKVADAPDTLYGRIDPVHELANMANQITSPYVSFSPLFVRTALGFNFAYLGFHEKLLNPGPALSVVDKYELSSIPIQPELWVFGAGVTEVILGLALILGLFTRAAAATAFLVFTLTLFALPDDPVLAHVTLFGLCSVLFVTGGGPLSLDSWLGLDSEADVME